MLLSGKNFSVRQWIQGIESLIFPFRCLQCGTYIDPPEKARETFFCVFCRTCLKDGPRMFAPPFCPQCGRLFDLGENHLCEVCLKRNPKVKRIGRVRAALTYTGVTRQAIPLFKYQSRLSLARIFEQLLFDAFGAHFTDPEPDLLLPVPLHPRKMRKRGFNQSFLLIRHFPALYARRTGRPPSWKMETKVLERVIHTRPQTGLDEKSRKKNLKNAFQISQTGRVRVRDARILLVDDVYTTGTTCAEAAKVLFRNRARQVDVLVLARA